MSAQIDMRVATGSRRAAHEEDDDDEREDDGRRCAKEVIRERQRQIIALAETMGTGGRRPNASRRDRDHAGADHPRGWTPPTGVNADRPRRRQAGCPRAHECSRASPWYEHGSETFRSSAP